MIAPWPGETAAGRWHTSVPYGLAATIVDSAPASLASQQIWKPHPKQEGPTWWKADLGQKQTVRAVRVEWVKPGPVSVTAELSTDGVNWRPWSRANRKTEDEAESIITAAPAEAQYVRLEFNPSQFEGTRTIQILLGGRPGAATAWAPRIQRVWYEELRKYTPDDGFHRSDYADGDWKPIQVPGYWEVQRFSPPTWWQPDDTVGCYRRTFDVPESWRGRHVRLRFEGVNNSAQIWINGEEIGYHESGFTAFEYDVSPHLRYGDRNTIAVRVQKWTLTHEYDTDDVWFLGGIWRSVYLYSLPAARIDDYWIRTELDRDYRDAVLRARVTLRSAGAVRDASVEGELYDSSGSTVPLGNFRAQLPLGGREAIPVELAAHVPGPRKWTAETPSLYSLLLRLRVGNTVVHEFRTTVGFRQVEVRGASILLNGVPITIRGVVTTRANPTDADEPREQMFAREIRLLKEGNINAIRSHTTPLEEDFLDLCDRHGIYVIPDVPDVWVNEYDFRYLTDGNVLRAREIFEQHKNRASVIAWHIGNENGLSSVYRGMGQAALWLHEADTTRPVMICSNRADLAEFGTAINDQHYSPMTREEFLKPAAAPVVFGEFHALPEEIARLRDRGFVETWGRSFQLEWAEFRKRPWVAGGLICCWDDGSVNGDPGPRQWGVVDSKRQAKAVHYHIRKVFSPVQLALESVELQDGRVIANVAVQNEFNFTDLSGFRFQWRFTAFGKELRAGEEKWRVQPGNSARMEIAVELPGIPDRLEVSVIDTEGYAVQSESFPLRGTIRPAQDAREILSRIGAGEERSRALLRVRATSQGELTVTDAKGAELMRVQSLLFQRGRSREANVPIGALTCGEPAMRSESWSVPCSVEGKVAGSMVLELKPGTAHVSWNVTAAEELALREAGTVVRVAPAFTRLSWNRDSLWNAGEPGTHDGPLETNVPIEKFTAGISRRNIYWAEWKDSDRALLLIPDIARAALRSTQDGAFVVSDLLGAGDFLGKFDHDTIEQKVLAGERIAGGFTVVLLTPAQTLALDALPASAKDLTWSRRSAPPPSAGRAR